MSNFEAVWKYHQWQSSWEVIDYRGMGMLWWDMKASTGRMLSMKVDGSISTSRGIICV